MQAEEETPTLLEGELMQLRAAANALLERAILARSLGMTHAGKRDVYGVLGYDDSNGITWQQYRERYARGGIAGRVVDALAKATWRGEGIIYEDEDNKDDTEFEKAWKDLNKQKRVWSTLMRAHILASLGSFSVLLLGAPGQYEEELPRGKPGGLLYVTPFAGDVVNLTTQSRGQSGSFGADAVVSKWVEDTRDPRFGQPLSYQLKRTRVGAQDLTREVHWTRVIHLPAPGFLDDAVFGPPALEATWNYFIDLDKVVGGGAEAFWLRANAGTQIDIDKKTTMSSDPNQAQAELDRLKEQAELYAHQMTRIMRTRGVNINQLGSDVADFTGPADTILTLIAGTTGIPKRILTGSEMGELASSQDRDNWNDQVKDCRDAYAQPVILQPFIDRLIKYGYLPTPAQWEVEWPDVEAMSEEEKLDAAAKAQALNAGGEIVITGAEIRETYLDREPLTKDELQVESWRADLAVKMATVNKTQGMPVFTDEEIRKLCYGWSPLTDAQKEAGTPVPPTPPVPVDANGNPVKPKPLTPAEQKTLMALEAALEANDVQAIAKLLDVTLHDE